VIIAKWLAELAPDQLTTDGCESARDIQPSKLRVNIKVARQLLRA
jgi:hypothetical protein